VELIEKMKTKRNIDRFLALGSSDRQHQTNDSCFWNCSSEGDFGMCLENLKISQSAKPPSLKSSDNKSRPVFFLPPSKLTARSHDPNITLPLFP
jgi:hypothetical protein